MNEEGEVYLKGVSKYPISRSTEIAKYVPGISQKYYNMYIAHPKRKFLYFYLGENVYWGASVGKEI